MKNILYSKNIDSRVNFVRSIFRKKQKEGVNKIFYLLPKKFISDVSERLSEAEFIPFEDVTKSNYLFNNASDNTLLVLDRPSRYKNITSNVFVRLSRIASKYEHKAMVDIVPFTTDIQYLYCPLAFIDRGILGYQHWYSFRENNYELNSAGEETLAHDYFLLAEKMKDHIEIDYDNFFSNDIEIIDVILTKKEQSEYKKLRDKLFEENTSASPIITKLADWTNVTESKYNGLQELLDKLEGNTVVYTNLTSHNRRLRKRFKKYNISIKSYYDTNGDEDQYDNVILFEVPIVKNYLFLDVIANIRSDCKVYIFCADTTVDKYLYKKMSEEYTQLNEFTKVLYEVVNNEGC